MWEWSGKELKSNEKTKSLTDAYDDLLYNTAGYMSLNRFNQDAIIAANNTPQITSIDEMAAYLYTVMENFGLKDIELKAHKPTPKSWNELNQGYAEYRKIRSTFLKFTGFHDQEGCRLLGMNDEDIKLLQKGIAPENFCAHLKLPFDFGGEATINNLCLVRSHPTHLNIHKIIGKQLQNGFIRHNELALIPFIEERIYYG